MKNFKWAAAVVIIIVGIVVILSTNKTNETVFPVLIPLTGGNAEQGEWYKRGFEVAQKEIEKYKGKKARIVFEDTKGDPKTAVSAYESLKARYNFPAVFTWGSGVGIALTPLVNKDHIVQFGFAVASDAYSTPDDYTFRNFPPSSTEVQFIVSKMKDMGISNVALYSINNDYGKSIANAFKKQFAAAGENVVADETFNTGDTDFRSTIAKLKNTAPQAMFLVSYPAEGALILKQSSEANFKTQVISSTAIIGGKSFFDVAGTGAEGLIVSNNTPLFGSIKISEEATLYQEEYKELFGVYPTIQDSVGSRSYDALKIVEKVLSGCPPQNADCLKDGLYKISDYQGAMGGPQSFDRNGDVTGKFSLIEVKDGKFVEKK